MLLLVATVRLHALNMKEFFERASCEVKRRKLVAAAVDDHKRSEGSLVCSEFSDDSSRLKRPLVILSGEHEQMLNQRKTLNPFDSLQVN